MINPLDVAVLVLALGSCALVFFGLSRLPRHLKGVLSMLEALKSAIAHMAAARARLAALVAERDAALAELTQSRARVAELEAIVGADADALAQAVSDLTVESEALAAA
jgi:hypothetical protein